MLGGTALVGCTPTGPSVPAVTRNAPDPFEGGIGGTGIVGVMTDFGSLIVNGLRVEVDGRTRFRSAFGPVSEGAALPGRSLTILATKTRDQLVARDVAVDLPLIGLVRPGAGGAVTVNGIEVRAEAGAVGTLRLGRRVALSGVWTATGFSASRIDPADTDLDVIAGTFRRAGPTGAAIGTAPLRLASTRPADGSYLAARGRFGDGVFAADAVRRTRFPLGTTGLRQLSVEGYLEPQASAPGFRVAGLGHSFARDLQLAPLARHRAIYFGPYDGRFRAAAGYIVPDGFGDRRALLADGVTGAHGGPVIRTR